MGRRNKGEKEGDIGKGEGYGGRGERGEERAKEKGRERCSLQK